MNFEFIKLNNLDTTLSNISETNNSQNLSIDSLQSNVNNQGSQIDVLQASGVNLNNQINLTNSNVNNIISSGVTTSQQINLINSEIQNILTSGSNFQNQIDFINSFDKLPSGGSFGQVLQFQQSPQWDQYFEKIDVLVSSTNENDFFVFNNIPQNINSNKILKLRKNQKYIFNTSHPSNTGYTLRFSDIPDGIHSSGVIFNQNISYGSHSIIFNNVEQNIIFPFCVEVSGFCGIENNSSYITFDNSPRIISGDKNLKIDELLLVDRSINSNLYLLRCAVRYLRN
jgi:hypothetical protein